MTEERFALYDQAKAELGASVDEQATTLILTERSSTLDEALGHVDSEATPPVVVALVLDDGEHWEAVRVTAWDSDNSEATVDRGAWDSEARAWDSGTPAELRVVAAVYQQAYDRIEGLEDTRLQSSNNLSDVDDPEQARENLELDGALMASNNLSELEDAEQARQNLEVSHEDHVLPLERGDHIGENAIDSQLVRPEDKDDEPQGARGKESIILGNRSAVPSDANGAIVIGNDVSVEGGEESKGVVVIAGNPDNPDEVSLNPGDRSLLVNCEGDVTTNTSDSFVFHNFGKVDGSINFCFKTWDEVNGSENICFNTYSKVDGSGNVSFATRGEVEGGWNVLAYNWTSVVGDYNVAFLSQDKVDGINTIALQTQDKVDGDRIVALHSQDKVVGNNNVALQSQRDVVGQNNTALQSWFNVEGDYNTALHNWGSVTGDRNVALQNNGLVRGDHNIAIAGESQGPDGEEVNYTIALGASSGVHDSNPAKAKGDNAIAIGGEAEAESDSIAIGGEAEAESNSIAIGFASSAKTGTNQVAGFPLAAHKGDEETFWDRSGQKGVLRALKDTVDDENGASVAIPVPDGTVLFVDAVSLVVRSTDTPEGDVNVHVHAAGTDLVNEDRAAGDWSQWHRHRWDADSLDGIPGGTDLEVEVGSTDSGSAEVEVILEGILVSE